MTLLTGGATSSTVAAILVVACLVSMVESRVLLHPPSQGIQLQRLGRELLGSRSSEISNPAPAGNPLKRRGDPPPEPPPEPGVPEGYPPPAEGDCDLGAPCEGSAPPET